MTRGGIVFVVMLLHTCALVFCGFGGGNRSMKILLARLIGGQTTLFTRVNESGGTIFKFAVFEFL